uniref:Putative secreted protein n=1 Tax=Anopheles triannulatus TaxID=58253 RepID=A0A2M4B7C7_9DIPT
MMPIACFPIAHWYVLRGLWLWCGYGTSPAQTPSSVNGSISRCVVFSGSMSRSWYAMNESFSSFTSRYSIRPSCRKSSNLRSPSFSCSMCSCRTSGRPACTMMYGRHSRPPSV